MVIRIRFLNTGEKFIHPFYSLSLFRLNELDITAFINAPFGIDTLWHNDRGIVDFVRRNRATTPL